ncbi:hypothetical protein MBLNU459_g1306t1 [Dothideomycetes sp. NU459]
MRTISRTYSALSEPAPEEKPLSFRSVALLYPPKDVLARVRKNHSSSGGGGGGSVEPAMESLEPMFDEDDDVDFPIPADQSIRVIIAQDDAGVSIDRVLYDSKDTQNSRERPPKQSRPLSKISLFRRVATDDDSQNANNQSGLARARPATNSSPASPKRPAQQPSTPSSFVPPPQSRRGSSQISLADARHDAPMPVMDTPEELDSWMDCMFGKTQMRYRGAMTKTHVLQRLPRDTHHARGEQRPQRGGANFSRNASKPSPLLKPEGLASRTTQALLISRTFAVPLVKEDLPTQPRRAPAPMESTPEWRSNRAPKRRSTPLFGITVVIPLAKPRQSLSTAAGSPDIHVSVSLSDSEQSLKEVDDPIRAVMDHWQAINRMLDALQATAALQIHQQLTAQLNTQPCQGASRLTRLIKLDPQVFRNSQPITEEVDAAISRLMRSFRIPHVVPQGEWNVWRDELLDTSRSRDLKTHKLSLDSHKVTFLQTAITAALSSNLSWLTTVAPPQFQTRLRSEEKRLCDAADVVQDRTVVVAHDQNKARHLLYLLAKFLPPQRPDFERAPPPDLRLTPKVSALTQGLKAVGNTPSETNGHAGAPLAARGANQMPAFYEPYQASPSTSPIKRTPRMGTKGDPSSTKLVAGKIMLPSERGTPAMPIASAPGSSYTTPAGSPEGRPGSSAGAQGELMRHLQRHNSGTTSSTESTSFWNSFRSNTWSLGPRRESSITERSDSVSGTSQRDQILPSILKSGRSSTGRHGGTKLVRMLEEVDGSKTSHSYERNDSAFHTRESTPSHFSHTPIAVQFGSRSPPGPELQYSYDADEGVVNVDLDLGDAGPEANRLYRKTRVLSSPDVFPVFHGQETYGSLKARPLSPRSSSMIYDRAAGYLETLHPDYALQAVKPYTDLLDDIKRAMKAEPSPKLQSPPTLEEFYPLDDWIDVCSTVVVDAESLTTRRVSLRRHVRYHLLKQDESIALPRQTVKVNGDSHTTAGTPNSDLAQGIKVTKSEDMDSISRIYRRNEQGQKLAWKDKKVVRDDCNAHARDDSLKTTEECQRSTSDSGTSVADGNINGNTNGSHVETSVIMNDFVEIAEDQTQNDSAIDDSPLGPSRQSKMTVSVGDDLSAFIDTQAKNKPNKSLPKITTTSRIAKRNAEGKITGWQDVNTNLADEPGLHDLPASFLDRKRESPTHVIHTQVIEETFKEEVINVPEPAVVHILELILASSESRSAAPSRANSLHGRSHSRSNSLSGSGLLELQHESKKIVEDALQGLIISVAEAKHHAPHRPSFSSGLFSFGRSAAPSHQETSILHQSIAKWLG